MIKEGRKPSADPVQEKLRQHKAEWNKTVSTLIDNVINFKKMMNGFPSKFHMERAKITEALPKDPATIIGVLAGDFQEIATDANQIIQEQIAYSQTRRKPKPKQLSLPLQQPKQTNPNQLELFPKAELEVELISEGSNRLSRFISKFKGPWFGDSPEAIKNKERKNLLSEAVELDDMLEVLEGEVVSFTIEGLMPAKVLLDSKLNDKFKSFSQLYQYYSDKYKTPEQKTEDQSKKNKPKDQTITPDPPKENILDTVVGIMKDYRSAVNNISGIDHTMNTKIQDLMLKFRLTKNPAEKEIVAAEIIDAHKEILDDLNKKKNTSAKSLLDLVMSKKASDNLNKIADNMISKWLGKTYHKYSIFNKTSALRLEAFNIIKEIRKKLNIIMDLLENNTYVPDMTDQISDIGNSIVDVKKVMNILMFKITGKWSDKQMQDFLLNEFMSGRFSEHGYDLNDKDIEKLKKQLTSDQAKKIREMMGNK